MSRLYIQPSWVDACSDHTEWSGQSPDDRKRSSHMIGNKANLEAYKGVEETNSKAKAAPKKNIKEQIIPASATLDKLDTQEKELYKAFEAEEISLEDFEQCIHALEIKRSRAWRSYVKHAGISEENDYPVYTDQEIKNTVFHGVFPNEKACFDGHSNVPCKPMSTTVFLALVAVATIALLVFVN